MFSHFPYNFLHFSQYQHYSNTPFRFLSCCIFFLCFISFCCFFLFSLSFALGVVLSAIFFFDFSQLLLLVWSSSHSFILDYRDISLNFLLFTLSSLFIPNWVRFKANVLWFHSFNNSSLSKARLSLIYYGLKSICFYFASLTNFSIKTENFLYLKSTTCFQV